MNVEQKGKSFQPKESKDRHKCERSSLKKKERSRLKEGKMKVKE